MPPRRRNLCTGNTPKIVCSIPVCQGYHVYIMYRAPCVLRTSSITRRASLTPSPDRFKLKRSEHNALSLCNSINTLIATKNSSRTRASSESNAPTNTVPDISLPAAASEPLSTVPWQVGRKKTLRVRSTEHGARAELHRYNMRRCM